MSRGSRSAIARNTLRECESGTIVFNGAPISIAAEIAAARQKTETLLPADLQRLLDAELSATASSTFETTIEFVAETSLAGLARCEVLKNDVPDGSCAVLNFASAKNPGGGFLGGASAQEESLARSSALFPCIEKSAMYKINRRDNAQLVYHDVAVYTPACPFFKNDDGDVIAPVFAGVLTMPAPNAGCLRRGVTPDQLRDAVQRRVFAVLALAAAHRHTHLVLGAYGCGVFKNDVGMVAQAFKSALLGAFKGRFAHVTFSITGANFEPFRAAFAAAAVSTPTIAFVPVRENVPPRREAAAAASDDDE